jgi:hypothetical protein
MSPDGYLRPLLDTGSGSSHRISVCPMSTKHFNSLLSVHKRRQWFPKGGIARLGLGWPDCLCNCPREDVTYGLDPAGLAT